jgi:hypothetical protein
LCRFTAAAQPPFAKNFSDAYFKAGAQTDGIMGRAVLA